MSRNRNYNRGNPNSYRGGSDNYTDVYIDGSCLGNGRSGARAGYGNYWGPDHPNNVSEPVSGRATNNAGEIQGATRAINDAGSMGTTRLRVNTDSEFLMKSVNGYMPTWKQNDWHKADGNPVVNHNDFRNLDRAMRNNSQMDVTFRHVPAHSGNPGNEGADRLAKQGAQRYGDGYY